MNTIAITIKTFFQINLFLGILVFLDALAQTPEPPDLFPLLVSAWIIPLEVFILILSIIFAKLRT